MRIAIVDGCVAATFPVPDMWQQEPDRWAALVAPQLVPAEADVAARRDQVVVRPPASAAPDHAFVLAVGADGAVSASPLDTVRRAHAASPLRLVAALDDRRGGIARLLDHPDLAVQAAALTRALQAPDADECVAIAAWLDRSHVARHPRVTTAALRFANAPCLVPAIRRALDEPALTVAASEALARLASPDAKAEAILAILRRWQTPGWEQATEALAANLHPDHCGPSTAARCLTPAAAKHFEWQLGLLVAPNPPPEEEPAYAVLSYFRGSARAVRTRTREQLDSAR